MPIPIASKPVPTSAIEIGSGTDEPTIRSPLPVSPPGVLPASAKLRLPEIEVGVVGSPKNDRTPAFTVPVTSGASKSRLPVPLRSPWFPENCPLNNVVGVEQEVAGGTQPMIVKLFAELGPKIQGLVSVPLPPINAPVVKLSGDPPIKKVEDDPTSLTSTPWAVAVNGPLPFQDHVPPCPMPAKSICVAHAGAVANNPTAARMSAAFLNLIFFIELLSSFLLGIPEIVSPHCK
jgi:hypothetical protein